MIRSDLNGLDSKIFLFIIIICTIGNTIMAQNFKAEQLKKSRVKQAYNNTTVQLDPELDQFFQQNHEFENYDRSSGNTNPEDFDLWQNSGILAPSG